MPTRLIRDGILDSKPVNSLSEQAELFYRRLMSIVDDYGRFEADADLIRARCFPRQFDRWTPERIEQCLSEVSGDSPLVTVYHCGNKRLLQINNFGQRLQSKPKYPGPDSQESTVGKPQSTVIHREKPSSRSRISESETDSQSDAYSEPETVRKAVDSFRRISNPTGEWAGAEKFDAAWARHRKNRGKTETYDTVVRALIGIDLDWDEVERKHIAFCAEWDKSDWHMCSMTFLEWVQNKMPAAVVSKDSKVNGVSTGPGYVPGREIVVERPVD